ncbi:MAG: nucleoside-diphosphate sugar epimerase/dehydratase [Proteobacteria bacterium]|nr:nucleoside-diphosphate sugar epimerase/dehydratase [Pseudomonadota bacterium]
MLNLNIRNVLAFTHDVLAVFVAWVLAYCLRFNFQLPPPVYAAMLDALYWLVPLHAGVAWKLGLYRGLWRYASLADLKRIFLAVGLSGVLVAAIVSMASLQASIPRTVLVLHPIGLILLMSGSRIAYRIFKEYRLYGHASLRGEPVLVVGTGDAAVDLLRELRRSAHWHVVGLLDDEPGRWGRDLYGVKVLGGIDELPAWAERFTVRNVILALPSATAERRRHALEVASGARLTTLTVPAFADLLSGRFSISQIRHVELEDLLGREEVALDNAGLDALIRDQVIMVTGAGGSIGSELCRQIARYRPRTLVLFELSEFALYRISEEFAQDFPEIAVVPVIGDVRDYTRVSFAMREWAPQLVFHAAAYKHVPLMESINAWEAISNNVLGTLTLAEAAVATGVRRFVFVSTDKAVNPSNVMGVTKRLAERICMANQGISATRFVVVRFGNVLGSTGSVIPKFRQQILAGGPITVTHPDITRFFMTIPEAAQLVLQAALMGKGGEVFVLDMGEPVKIVDLARDMIRLSGFSESEIGIVFTGLRPGEKLSEELMASDERTLPTPHAKLRIAASENLPSGEWLRTLEARLADLQNVGAEEIRERLRELVPEYRPQVS